MMKLLLNKADVILKGKDLKTWKQSRRKRFYSFFALLFWLPLDTFAFECHQPKWVMIFSIMYLPIAFVVHKYHSLNDLAILNCMTKKYLTHLSDEELDREVSLAEWSIFRWITNANKYKESLIRT